MENMSYCKFENTYHDLKDCWEDALEWEHPANTSEEQYREKLIKLCKEIAENT